MDDEGKKMMTEDDRADNAARDSKRRSKAGTAKRTDNATIKKIIYSIIAIVLIFGLIFTATFEGVATKTTQKNKIKDVPATLYETLGVDDLYDFIEIKGDDEEGWYLDFVDDADKKLDKAIKNIKDKNNVSNLNKDLLKRMIKAEVVTQYPFLRGAGGNGSSYAGNTVAEKVWNFLISNGYSEIAVAGVMGNIHQESGGFNPDIVENGGSGEGIGLIQWSFGRRDKLEAYAQAMGKPWSDVDLQLDYLLMELQGGSEYAEDGWNGSRQHQQNWENAETVEEAAIIFEDGFERAGTPMIENRIHWANIYYEQYRGTFTPNNGQDSEVSSVDSLEGVLFIGDSITQGLGQSGAITDEGVQFYGVESSHVKDWLNNTSINGNATWSSLPEDSDDIKGLCVMLGTNDGGAMSAASEMKALLEKLHEKYPDKMIFVQKLLPLEGYSVSQYNSEIESYCSQNSGYLTFIDSTEGVTLADGVHPTQEGYNTLAENTRRAIQNNGGVMNAKGFQGTIRIRRVTPNKNIGETKNTGAGSVTSTGSTRDNAGVADYITNSATSGTWSVYAKNLFSNEEKININNKKMKSASVIKIFIMAAAFGEISEERVEKSEVINDIRAMITTSDNDATNRLIDKLGFARINSFIQGQGCNSTELNRKMLEQTTHGDNYTSVRDVGKILESIYRGNCISKEASAEMLEILKAQTRTNKIPAGVPDGVVTANKTGEIYEGSKVENDAAIVFKENSAYVLVVMSNDIQDNEAAVNDIKEISKRVYNTINSSSSSDGGTNSNAKHKIAIVAGHGSTNNAGTYDDVINKTKYYTKGAEGVVSGKTLKEWKLTQKVADYVERYLSSYSDISVFQVGYSNPDWERMQLAKNKGVDAYITIHFDSSSDASENGITAYYKSGDNTSKDFANILTGKVADSMKLENKGAKSSTNQNCTSESIGNSSEWGFPSVLINGGFMTNSKDMAVIGEADEVGLKKYAQGIAAGILDHYNIESTGLDGATNTSSTTDTYTAVNSKIYDLRYVSPEKFESLVNSSNESERRQALRSYTLDEETKKLKIANWSYSTEEGLKITESNLINYRSVINKYTMPFEYLLAFLVHTDDKKLVSDLADLAIDSEFIIAVQDNVTTTQTTVDYQEKTYRDLKFYDSQNNEYYTTAVNINDWHHVDEGSSVKVLETVSNKIELTYADTWFVKFYKTSSSYSTMSFDSATGNNLVGDQGSLIGNFKITAYCTACNSPRGSTATASGAVATPNRTIAVHLSDYNGNGPISKGKQVIINGQVYTVEDNGDSNHIHPDNWIDIFIETENGRCVCNSSPVNSNSTPVYSAENVRQVEINENEEASDEVEQEEETEVLPMSEVELKNKNLKGLNTVANVSGKVTDTTTVREERLDTIRNDVVGTNGWQIDITERKNIITVRTVSNKYDSGTDEVKDNSQKFIDIFKECPARYQFNVEWMADFLQQSEKTVNMIDLTKYLYDKAIDQIKDRESEATYKFDVYKVNDFSKIYRSSGILEEYLKSLENNALRLYMNNHVSYVEGYEEQEIEKYVVENSEEPKYKIFQNDEGGWGFGYNIFHRLNEEDWNTGSDVDPRVVEHYSELGIDNIKSYVEDGMEMEVDIVDQVMRLEIEKWKEKIDEGLANNGLELEEYQRDVLVIIAYKYGWSNEDMKSFKDAYQRYYERDLKDEFRKKFDIAQKTIQPLYVKDEQVDNDKLQKENNKIQALWHLFDTGEYRTLEGEVLDPDSFTGFGSTEFLGAAEEIWRIVCERYTTYGALGNVPPPDSQQVIDCSGYVSWVLYQYGLNTNNDALVQQFNTWQHTTESLKSVDWERLGFEVIPVAAGQDVRGILQPGDILDRSAGDGPNGHVNICVDVTENGNVLVYDCGSTSHWIGKNGEPSTSTNFAASDRRAGIIIRKK